MSKILWSVRVDSQVPLLLESLNDFRVRLGLKKVSVGDLLSDAVRFYVSDQMIGLKHQAQTLADEIDSVCVNVKVGE